MQNIINYWIILIIGVLLLIPLLAKFIQQQKAYCFVLGSLYVEAKILNSGNNPCDHNISKIEPIEVGNLSDNLYY